LEDKNKFDDDVEKELPPISPERAKLAGHGEHLKRVQAIVEHGAKCGFY